METTKNLYIKLIDYGYDIKDNYELNNELIVIPIKDKYLCSNTGYLLLRLNHEKDRDLLLKNIRESYNTLIISHSYNYKNYYFMFIIYRKTILSIIQETKNFNVSNNNYNYYISVSQNFIKNKITDTLEKNENIDQFIEIPKNIYTTYNNINDIDLNYYLKGDLKEAFYNVLENKANNIEKKSIKNIFNNFKNIIDNNRLDVSIKSEDGKEYFINEIYEILEIY